MTEENPTKQKREDAAETRNTDNIPALAQFSFVCESKGGRLCLYEDADGHYALARSDRLA